MKIAVGFITYNESSSKYLSDFLDSLFKALDNFSRSSYLILARDNSEKQNNPNQEYIENEINKNEKLINFTWSGANLGFSKAYNIMIKEALRFGADYFLMINPDTIITPEAISKLLAEINRDNSLASVCPKILRWDFEQRKLTKYIDTCGLSIAPGFVFRDIAQGVLDRGQFDQVNIIGPSGAAALFRLSALEKIKENGCYLDENMFMYKEDCDLAYRLFCAGYLSSLVPEAIIYHDRSISAPSGGLWQKLRDRSAKNRLARSWSHLNQHILIIKHWQKQSFWSKLQIWLRMSMLFIYVVLFERFLLKNYLIIAKYYLKGRCA
jgi:GT2 family glycosyltransferase